MQARKEILAETHGEGEEQIYTEENRQDQLMGKVKLYGDETDPMVADKYLSSVK